MLAAQDTCSLSAPLTQLAVLPDHVILGHSYDRSAGAARKAKSWKAGSNPRLPERKFGAAAAAPCPQLRRVSTVQAGSWLQPGLPGVLQWSGGTEEPCRTLVCMKQRGSLGFSSPLNPECPNPALCYSLCTHLQLDMPSSHRSPRCAFARGCWGQRAEAQGFSPAPTSLLPPQMLTLHVSEQPGRPRGGVRKTSYACDVLLCCWKVSKDISGAGETFQHIHFRAAVSLPSCIIYHKIPSCLKAGYELFSVPAFPLGALFHVIISILGVVFCSSRLFCLFSPAVLLQAQKVGLLTGKLLTRRS